MGSTELIKAEKGMKIGAIDVQDEVAAFEAGGVGRITLECSGDQVAAVSRLLGLDAEVVDCYGLGASFGVETLHAIKGSIEGC